MDRGRSTAKQKSAGGLKTNRLASLVMAGIKQGFCIRPEGTQYLDIKVSHHEHRSMVSADLKRKNHHLMLNTEIEGPVGEVNMHTRLTIWSPILAILFLSCKSPSETSQENPEKVTLKDLNSNDGDAKESRKLENSLSRDKRVSDPSACNQYDWKEIFRIAGKGWLHPIWASDANDIFVSSSDGAIYHFDGSAWKKQVNLSPARVWDINGLSRQELFAVGGYRTIARFDGNQWKKEYFEDQLSPRNAFSVIVPTADGNVHVFGESHYQRINGRWVKSEEGGYPWVGTKSYWKIRGFQLPIKFPQNVENSVLERFSDYWVIQDRKTVAFIRDGNERWHTSSKDSSCQVVAAVNNQLFSMCRNTIKKLAPSGAKWSTLALPIENPKLEGGWSIDGDFYIQLQSDILYQYNGDSWEKSLESDTGRFTNMKVFGDHIFVVTKRAVYCKKRPQQSTKD